MSAPAVQAQGNGPRTPAPVQAAGAAPDIVGGELAPADAYPWMVALFNPQGGTPAQAQFCGGSLIAAEWVLTAAHCLFEGNQVITGEGVSVLIDQADLTGAGGVTRSVSQVIAHPQYVASTSDFDYGLLRLSSAATGKTTVAIATGGQSALEQAGVDAVAIGWGATSSGGPSSAQLRHVTVPIVSNADCDASLGGITARMLCAGIPAGGIDSCQGDSGGPLVVNDAALGTWRQVGIVSWGNGCAEPNSPGVYARVSQVINWINETTGGGAPPTRTPTATPTGTRSVTATPTATRTATPTTTVEASSFLYLAHVSNQNEQTPAGLVNGGFEQGPGKGWSESSTQGFDLIVTDADGRDPHTGTYMAWLGGIADEVSILHQEVTIPAATPLLQYWVRVLPGGACEGSESGGVSIDGIMVDTIDLCVSTAKPWAQRTIDLAAHAGQTVQLRVRADTTGGNSLLVDDMILVGETLQAAQPAETPSPASSDIMRRTR
jgi:secreted trypsin-like serine protease